MDKFEEQFLGLLASKWNFYIKDYTSLTLKKNKYVAITENDNFAYCVIVSESKEADISYIEAKEELQKCFTKPVMVNVIVVVDDENYNNIDSNLYSKLIYSIKEKRVVYSHDGCKPLLPMFDYMKATEKTKKSSYKDRILTYILIAINIIVFIITAIQSQNIYNIDSLTLVNMGAKVNILINNGQVWRLLSCAFLHGGLTHIVFNMFALNIIGTEVEYAYGKVKYIVIYLISAIGGSVFSYIFSPKSISVGASGAVFGLLGAMLVFGFINRDKMGKAYMMNIVKVIGINIVIGLTISNIDNAAHLGGLIFGAVIATISLSINKLLNIREH